MEGVEAVKESLSAQSRGSMKVVEYSAAQMPGALRRFASAKAPGSRQKLVGHTGDRIAKDWVLAGRARERWSGRLARQCGAERWHKSGRAGQSGRRRTRRGATRTVTRRLRHDRCRNGRRRGWCRSGRGRRWWRRRQWRNSRRSRRCRTRRRSGRRRRGRGRCRNERWRCGRCHRVLERWFQRRSYRCNRVPCVALKRLSFPSGPVGTPAQPATRTDTPTKNVLTRITSTSVSEFGD